MAKPVLCKTCAMWVDCSKENETDGFCIMKDLFTNTAENECEDYEQGDPMTEKEFEKWNEF